MSDYKKIIITGMSASGKTTLARNLGKLLKLPVISIDSHCFTSDGKIKPVEQLVEIVSGLCEEDEWIIDGMYRKIAERFLPNADLVIFIQINMIKNIFNVIKRKLRHIFAKDNGSRHKIRRKIKLQNTKRVCTNRKGFNDEWQNFLKTTEGSYRLMKIHCVNRDTAEKIVKLISTY